jgi:hypothetical protein
MSYLGCHDRDLLIPPQPVRIGRATGPAQAWSLVRRPTPSKSRLGPVQEASLVGIVALSVWWAAAELAFLLFG